MNLNGDFHITSLKLVYLAELSLVSIFVLAQLKVVLGQGTDMIKQPEVEKQNWRIVFYTGDKVWAGTDSEIYIELIGDMGNSNIIRIRPKKHQLEADCVDIFPLGDLDGKNIGNLKSIIIGKQHSYSFFNDWQLVKIEIYDPHGKKYIFNCNCWLTTLKYKRRIDLSLVEGANEHESDETMDASAFNARNTRVFPATIGILFILLILIVFTYFGNEICKKWRENILYFTTNGRNRTNSSSQATTLSAHSRSDPNRCIYRNMDSSVNLPLNTGINLNNLIEDKPPEYKDLFPIVQVQNPSESNSIMNIRSDQAASHPGTDVNTQDGQLTTETNNNNASQTKFTSV